MRRGRESEPTFVQVNISGPVKFTMEDLDFSGLDELFRERFFQMLDHQLLTPVEFPALLEGLIERVLRHLHLWDPSWKRQRKVRGPPPPSFSRPSSTSQEASPSGTHTEVIDPVIADELYAIDPLPADEDGEPG